MMSLFALEGNGKLLLCYIDHSPSSKRRMDILQIHYIYAVPSGGLEGFILSSTLVNVPITRSVQSFCNFTLVEMNPENHFNKEF